MTFEGCNVECQDPKEMHGAQGPRGALGPRAAKSQPGVSGSNEAGLEAHKEINQGLGLYGGRQVRGVASTLRFIGVMGGRQSVSNPNPNGLLASTIRACCLPHSRRP